jgi:hypothetical protein
VALPLTGRVPLRFLKVRIPPAERCGILGIPNGTQTADHSSEFLGVPLAPPIHRGVVFFTPGGFISTRLGLCNANGHQLILSISSQSKLKTVLLIGSQKIRSCQYAAGKESGQRTVIYYIFYFLHHRITDSRRWSSDSG